jgi:hypothetical protein
MVRRCFSCNDNYADCDCGAPPRYRPLSLEREVIGMVHKLAEDTYVDIDGNVVDARDPRVQTFIGAAGAEIPEADARRYGLIGGKRQAAAHDEGIDPANAADPVVGGEPVELIDAKGADPADAAADDDDAEAAAKPVAPKPAHARK